MIIVSIHFVCTVQDKNSTKNKMKLQLKKTQTRHGVGALCNIAEAIELKHCFFRNSMSLRAMHINSRFLNTEHLEGSLYASFEDLKLFNRQLIKI